MEKKNGLNPENRAYEKALKFLGIRLHTEKELRRKLTLRGVNIEDINKVMHRLSLYGYINDAQFAEVFLDNLIKYKTFGYYMLLKKLVERGVEKAEADKLLREHLPAETEKELALKYLKAKKYSDKNKAIASLRARGFRSDVIMTIYK